jgi:small redox-active disulfide protein 2
MIIKVLGSGCAKCQKLEKNVLKAIQESGLNAQVVKVTDLQAIMKYGVISTPALVVDEAVKSTGRILSPSDIIKLIS